MTNHINIVPQRTNFLAPKSQIQVFSRRLFFWDFMVITIVMAITSSIFYISLPLDFQAEYTGQLRLQLHPIALALMIYLLFLAFIVIFKSWNTNIAGTGIPEYLMIAKVSVSTVGVLAFMALAFKLDVSRMFVAVSIISTTIGLIAHRWTGRQWLLNKRHKNDFMLNTALIGPASQIAELVPRLKKYPDTGYRPIAAALLGKDFNPKNKAKLEALGLYVTNYEKSTLQDENFTNLQAVMVLGSEHIDAVRIKRLAWALEETNIELVLAPALVDFAGERITPKSVAGLQFLQIQTPRFTGAKYFVKQIFDLVLTTIFTVITLPIMFITALAVKLEDGGPVFFLQERVGRNGKTFKMIKFRSMKVGAHKLHEDMKKSANQSPNKVLYKNPNDPRITKVGKFIRKFSIDELPQFFNILAGQMSLVGPRPPLLSEVNEYELDMYRRLLVKPGLTGLWQTSGRAELSFEESMRLDLTYVENWSIFGDLFILLKTVKIVLDRTGAH